MGSASCSRTLQHIKRRSQGSNRQPASSCSRFSDESQLIASLIQAQIEPVGSCESQHVTGSVGFYRIPAGTKTASTSRVQERTERRSSAVSLCGRNRCSVTCVSVSSVVLLSLKVSAVHCRLCGAFKCIQTCGSRPVPLSALVF